MLARELLAQASRGGEHSISAFTHAELDVRDDGALGHAITDTAPDWVINGSAYTDVDGAERDATTAYAVNGDAVGAMARLCREQRCALAHFSSDYVFPGTRKEFLVEDETPDPVNLYGASKLRGELLLKSSGARYLLIRTQWLYGVGGKSFISKLCDSAARGARTRVVDDQYGCCTYVADLVGVVLQALGRLEGTYHAANRGRVSRFAVAQRVFDALGVPNLVEPCRSAEFASLARRPASSMLDVTKIETALGIRLRDWQLALGEYLETCAQGV